MFTPTFLRRLVAAGTLLSFVIVSPVLQAADAPPPHVLETFACNFKAGNSWPELNPAIEFWNEQIDASGAGGPKNMAGMLLVPFRANVEYDMLILTISPDLNTWARWADFGLDNDGLGEAGRRFAELADCRSNLWFSSNIYQGFPPGPPANLDQRAPSQLFACKIREGQSVQDVTKAEQAWAAAMAQNKSVSAAFKWMPFRVANIDADYIYHMIETSYTDMAAGVSGMVGSKAGNDAYDLINRALDCDSGLFNRWWIRPPQQN